MKTIIYFAIAIIFIFASTLPVGAVTEYSCADVTEIPQLECEALVALYNSTNGQNWTYNFNWLTTNTPSDWWGVAVISGHVTGIDLNSNNLVGILPTEIGNFGSLSSLKLYNNHITGPLPKELGNLTILITLDLHYNQLNGSIVNSRAKFTTHSRVMFTSDDRVGVYHFKESFPLLLLIAPPFFWKFAGNFHLE